MLNLCFRVTLSFLFISQAYPTDKQSFCQVSPFIPRWSGYWVIKINFSIKQFHVHNNLFVHTTILMCLYIGQRHSDN